MSDLTIKGIMDAMDGMMVPDRRILTEIRAELGTLTLLERHFVGTIEPLPAAGPPGMSGVPLVEDSSIPPAICHLIDQRGAIMQTIDLRAL